MQTLLSVRVIPGVRQESLEQLADGSWKIRLRQRAIEGKANSSLCEKVADILNLSRSKVTVVRGEKSRLKLLRIMDLEEDVVKQLLGNCT